jgi:hypothetical protein
MSGLYADLARQRLRWYAAATANAVRRHWQWLVIACLLLPAGLPLTRIPGILAFPVSGMVQPGHGAAWYALHLVLVQLIAAGWIWPQRQVLAGGPMAPYVATLPIPRRIAHRVNVSVLLVADSLLLLPMLTALLVAPRADTFAAIVFQGMAVAAMGLSALAAQLALVERNWPALPLALACAAPWGWSLAHQENPGAWATMAVLLCASMALAAWTPTISRRITRTRLRSARKQARSHALTCRHALPISARIQLQTLFVERWPATLLRLAAAVGVTAGAGLLINAFAFDARTLPTAIAAIAAASLIVSGTYRTLAGAHAGMRHYAAALPLGKGFWFWRDIVCVSALGGLPLGIVLLPLLDHGVPALTCLKLALAELGLLALLRLPLLITRRQTVLAGAILAAGWSAAAMAAIH